jgi:hypothetical protein
MNFGIFQNKKQIKKFLFVFYYFFNILLYYMMTQLTYTYLVQLKEKIYNINSFINKYQLYYKEDIIYNHIYLTIPFIILLTYSIGSIFFISFNKIIKKCIFLFAYTMIGLTIFKYHKLKPVMNLFSFTMGLIISFNGLKWFIFKDT